MEEKNNNIPDNVVEEPVGTPRPAGEDVVNGASSSEVKKNDTNEAMVQALNALNQKLDNINTDIDKALEEKLQAVTGKLNTLSEQLPKTITPEKPRVMGYYDFDLEQKRFVNDNAQKEFERAREVYWRVNNMIK